jgi:hypothetical protein
MKSNNFSWVLEKTLQSWCRLDSHHDIGRGKFFSFWASERFPEQFFETG